MLAQKRSKNNNFLFCFVQEKIVTFGQLLLPLTCSRLYLFNNIQQTKMKMENIEILNVRRLQKIR